MNKKIFISIAVIGFGFIAHKTMNSEPNSSDIKKSLIEASVYQMTPHVTKVRCQQEPDITSHRDVYTCSFYLGSASDDIKTAQFMRHGWNWILQ